MPLPSYKFIEQAILLSRIGIERRQVCRGSTQESSGQSRLAQGGFPRFIDCPENGENLSGFVSGHDVLPSGLKRWHSALPQGATYHFRLLVIRHKDCKIRRRHFIDFVLRNNLCAGI